MIKLTSLFLSIILVWSSCINSVDSKTKVGDRLLEDPEHHIKDSPGILKFDSTILYTGWYYVIDDTIKGYKRALDKTNQIYYLDNHPIATAKNFTSFEIYEGNGGGQKHFRLAMHLDKEGTKIWSIATQKSIGLQLAFILDNRLLQIAKVNSQITGGTTALNRGDYSKQELENFKTIIERER